MNLYDNPILPFDERFRIADNVEVPIQTIDKNGNATCILIKKGFVEQVLFKRCLN